MLGGELASATAVAQSLQEKLYLHQLKVITE